MVTPWRRLIATSACAFVSIIVASCATPLVPPNRASAASVCSLQCKRLGECRPGWDLDACNRNCLNDHLLPFFRDDYVAAIKECLEKSTCDVLESSLERTCWLATRPEPSDVAVRAAHHAAAKDRLCVGSAYDTDHYLEKDRWRTLSDPVLAEMDKCEEMRCGNRWRSDCIRTALGITRQ
jgi:hypothetical protein